MPLVSVIMPAYNAMEFLESSVRSVLQQTFRDYELILVDDVSMDDTRDMIRKLASEDSRIRPLFLEENKGSAGARNMALQRASGRIIMFLDSDDIWLPEKMASQLAFMEEKQAPVVFSAYRRMTEGGELRGVVQVPLTVSYAELLCTNRIGMLTGAYDREQVGLRLLPDIRLNHDYALWLDILRDGHVAHGQPEVLAHYRVRSGSISRNKFHTARYQWRVFRELEQLSFFKSAYYFAQYTWHGFRKSRI